jgi:hypothetical protein
MSIHDSENTDEARVNDGSVRGEDGASEPSARPRLASTVVQYAGEPDRVTMYPPEASHVERMSTWLTADADACLDPEEMR